MKFVWKDPKLLYELQSRSKENLEDVSLTICSGTDMVNINYTHIVCPDAQTAMVWLNLLAKCIHNENIYYIIRFGNKD